MFGRMHPVFGKGHHPFPRMILDRLYDSILRTLDDKSLNGYEILQEMEEKIPWFSPGPDKIYPVLQLQVDRGHVSVKEEEGKKNYALTEEGKRYLEERPQEGESGFPFCCHGEDLPDDLKIELKQAKGQILELARGFHQREKCCDRDRMQRILGTVNRALREIGDIAKN
ncbi:MAG TPA: PadR family transcriptional regulator [Chroococcales cyanobacterium]